MSLETLEKPQIGLCHYVVDLCLLTFPGQGAYTLDQINQFSDKSIFTKVNRGYRNSLFAEHFGTLRTNNFIETLRSVILDYRLSEKNVQKGYPFLALSMKDF